MIAPVLFCSFPSGRIEAMLGKQVVAEIRSGFGGKMAVYYCLKLPVGGPVQPPKLARSITFARQQVLFRIADWIESCGPIFYHAAEHIRGQAEQERDVA
jgi:hypothetical protein